MLKFLESFRETLDFSVNIKDNAIYFNINGWEYFPNEYSGKLGKVGAVFYSQFLKDIERRFFYLIGCSHLEKEIDSYIRSAKYSKTIQEIFDEEFADVFLDLKIKKSSTNIYYAVDIKRKRKIFMDFNEAKEYYDNSEETTKVLRLMSAYKGGKNVV